MSFLLVCLHSTLLVTIGLTLRCSALRLPWSIRNRLLLLHLQPRPIHVQRYNDITPLLLVPIDLQSLVHASHRVSIRTRLGRVVWHSLDKHHGVRCRQWEIRILAREDYDCLVLGLLWHGPVIYLWNLSHHVVNSDVYHL